MRTVLMLALLASAGPARADVPPPPPRHSGDPAVVGKQLIAALGGEGAWRGARYFRFDAIFEDAGTRLMRTQYWDRKTGRYRLEGNGDEGPYRVYMNVDTRQGEVWLGGKKVTDAAKIKKWLGDAYEAYAHDTFWLLAPYRVFDTSLVTLGYYDLDKGGDIVSLDVRRLLGDGVSFAVQRYLMCVDRKSHLVSEWFLEGAPFGGLGPGWVWSDWQQHGPLVLSTLRTYTKGRTWRFDKITVSEKPDDAALTPPK